MNERQELLATLMESKYRPQKDAPGELLELLGQKHRLGKLKKEMERAQMLEERELLVVESAFTVATGSSSFRSSSPSVAPGVDEEMSTSAGSAQAEQAIHVHNWTMLDRKGQQ